MVVDAQTPEPTVEFPDTTESEVDSYSAEHETPNVHEDSKDSKSGADDIAPAERLEPIRESVGDMEEAMQKVNIND